MTVEGKLITDLIVKRKALQRLEDEIDDIYSNLDGMIINHPNHHYSVISYIDGDVVYLYCEDENGEGYNITTTLDELLLIFKKKNNQ
jgi:hypothetical protein